MTGCAEGAVGFWVLKSVVTATVLCHDHWSSSWIELTATAAQASAVICIFGHDAEMRARSDGCFGKFGIVVVGSHGPAAGALEDGKHEGGNLETATCLGVFVQGIVVHFDGCRDGSSGRRSTRRKCVVVFGRH